jgi:hypothetical protein
MIGCAKRGHWDLIKYTFFMLFYWLMMISDGYTFINLFLNSFLGKNYTWTSSGA